MDAYATTSQLADWLGESATALPDDALRLLERASEVVETYCLAGYAADRDGNPADPDERAYLADAACAQVEFWGLVSEEHGIAGVTTGTMSAGGISHDMPRELAPRARAVLDRGGFLTPGAPRPKYRTPRDLIRARYQ